MRHKASGPLARTWHRSRRVTARMLEGAAVYRPAGALVAVVAAFGLAVGGSITIGAVTGEPSTRAIDSAAPTVSREADRPDPTAPTLAPDGTPEDSPSEPDATEAAEPFEPSPSDVSESPVTDPETDSPSTPSPSTSLPGDQYREVGDTTPPETSVLAEQPEPDSALFAFGADEEASFTCSLDGAAFTPCNSPSLYSNLQPGWHTFAVTATDAAGNADPTPAETSWLAKDSHATGP